jgi:thioesterase domain-containing protein/NADP-dependent 3-hydroxy acid dehydrogenase YdfG/acyl carrier protein
VVSVRGERILHPERAVLAGVCRVAPQEYPNLRCVHLDVDNIAAPGIVARTIITEAIEMGRDHVIAFRDGTRWVETIEPSKVEPGPNRLRRRGVYLITGGLGALGFAVATWLARDYQARLVLVSRDAERRAEYRGDELEKLKHTAGDVLICSADVSDREAMKEVIARVRQRFGGIDGVIHAAGILDDGIIQLKTSLQAGRVLKPKLEGTQVLAGLLCNTPLDFLVLFSSLSSVAPPAGQVDYCAANAFLNAFARSRPSEENVFSISWDAWGEDGMAVRADNKQPAGPTVSHPLLLRVESDTDSALSLSGSLSADQHWVLSEHRLLDGDALLPGTVHLELAVFLGRHRMGEHAIRLENLTFLTPYRVPAGHSSLFRAQIRRSEAGFEFSTISGDATFATGLVYRAQENDQRIDLESIKLRCTDAQQAWPQHPRQEEHFRFGPRWRAVKHIAFGQRECLASLELPKEFQSEVRDYYLHPSLLDAATGVALFLVPGCDKSGDLLLPFSYKRVTIYSSLPARIYSHARSRPLDSSDVATFDITITDENRKVVLEIEEFAVKRISGPLVLSDDRKAQLPLPSLVEPPPSGNPQDGRISTREGIEILRMLLESGAPQSVIVSPVEPHPAVTPNVPAMTDRRVDRISRGDTGEMLLDLWQQLLGLDAISLDADFFDLGGHSLVALRLFSEVRRRFQVELGLSTIFQARTVRSLARLIDSKRVRANRSPGTVLEAVVPIQPSGTKPPLFCVHGVGGNVLNYEALARHLGANQPVYGLQSIGLCGLAPDQTITEMAAHYIPAIRSVQPSGPYFVCGQSFGGLVAYEIARQLSAQGLAVGLIGLIDTFLDGVPGTTLPSLLARLHSNGARFAFHCRNILVGPDRLDYLRRRTNTRKRKIRAFLNSRRYRRLEKGGRTARLVIQEVKEANWLAARTYVPGTYHGTVALFRCKVRSPGDSKDHSMGWKTLVSGQLSIFEVPGDHLSMMTEPGVAVLAQELTACIGAVQAAPLPWRKSPQIPETVSALHAKA